MIKFKGKHGFSYKTAKGKITAIYGIAEEKPSVVLKVESNDGLEKHDILLSQEAAFAVSALMQLALCRPMVANQPELGMEEGA